MKLNHFMTTLLLDPYFKIKGWIYRGILEILVKKLLNLILFPLISPNFGGMKIWDFKEIKRNEYFLPLKLPNNEMSFPFFPLKLSNKAKKEYSKIILFISFHSIQFPSPKWGLKVINYYLPMQLTNEIEWGGFESSKFQKFV